MQQDQQQVKLYNYMIVQPSGQEPDSLTFEAKPYNAYLDDSLNIQQPEFKFELKDIIIPQVVDTTEQQVKYDQQSIIYPYKTRPVKILPVEREVVSYEWLSGFFILCLILLAWIRYEGQKRIWQLYRAAWARHNLNQLSRDGNLLTERITPALMFIYVISLSTLAINLAKPYNLVIPGAENPFSLFSIIAGVVLIFWFIKMATIKFSGLIFKTKNESDEYLLTNVIFNTAAGLAALPFVVAGHYTGNENILYIALTIFIAALTLRFIRSIFVGLSAQSFPVVYLFLYLCTLEILPFLVIYKLVV